jgi:hypothetical protein
MGKLDPFQNVAKLYNQTILPALKAGLLRSMDQSWPETLLHDALWSFQGFTLVNKIMQLA